MQSDRCYHPGYHIHQHDTEKGFLLITEPEQEYVTFVDGNH